MIKNLIAFILLSTVCFSVSAQMKTNLGFETGINLSRFPSRFLPSGPRTNYNDSYSKETDYSLPAPVFGLSYNTYVRKHFAFSLGIDYKRMNNYHLYNNEYPDIGDTDYFHTNEFYNKICLPVTAGIQFGKRLHPKIYIGFEPNYFLSGKIKIKNIFEWNDSGTFKTSIGKETINNTFSKYEFRNTSRFRGQVLLGFSISISKHLEFNAAIHQGLLIEGKYPKPDPTCYECEFESISPMYVNRDFTFTLKYFLEELYSSKNKEVKIRD